MPAAVLGPASRRLIPVCGGLGHACGANAGNADNLLDCEMRPSEPQQTGIAFRARQGLKQRGIYARQGLMRDDKGILVGNPPTWENLLWPDPPRNFLEMLAIATGTSDNIEHRGRITDVKGIIAQLICPVA